MATLTGLVSCRIQDALGVEVSMELPIQVPDTNTIAATVTGLAGWQTVLDGVSGGQITAATLRLSLPLTTGIKSSPKTDSEVERTGLWNYSQTGSPYKYGIDVPSLDTAVVLNGKIDLTNQFAQAFDAWLKIAHSQVQAVSKYGLLLVAIVDALISFRKHRRAESRRSFEV